MNRSNGVPDAIWNAGPRKVAEAIRKLRTELGRDQKEIADAAGISTPTMSRLEGGEIAVGREYADRVFDAMARMGATLQRTVVIEGVRGAKVPCGPDGRVPYRAEYMWFLHPGAPRAVRVTEDRAAELVKQGTHRYLTAEDEVVDCMVG